MFTGTLRMISLHEIYPLYTEWASEQGVEKRVRQLVQKQFFDFPLAVQEYHKPKVYYLVRNYPEYMAYLRKYSDDHLMEVPCFVQPFTSETSLRIDLLRKMFTPNTYTWLDKHNLIMNAWQNGEDIRNIALRTGTSERLIKSYLIDTAIPSNILEQADSGVCQDSCRY